MPGKRERLAHLLDRTGALRACRWALGVAPTSWLTVLTYHRISEPSREGRFDPGVIDATPAQFDRHVAFLTENFHVIGIDELREHLRGAPLPKNAVLVTFDDGYRDCLQNALPILQRHGARAVFFIATSYTSERRLYWWDRIAYAVRTSARDRLELAYPERRELPLGSSRSEALGELLALVKRHVGLDLDRFLAEVTRAAGIEWDGERERELADELIMTWDEVAELAGAGMDVQSHTRTHRVLDTLAPEELDAELRGSRRDLEEHLGVGVTALAYPVGYRIAGERRLVAAVREAGYEVGFTNGTGANRAGQRLDPLDLRRHAMDAEMPDEMFRGIVSLPPLARTRAVAR